jgi:hypothetical protein
MAETFHSFVGHVTLPRVEEAAIDRTMVAAAAAPTPSVGDFASRTSCVYRKLKHGRSGDEVRPGWRVN